MLEFLKDEYGDKDSPFPSALLEDEMKKEHLQKVWGNYTAKQMEEALPAAY